MCRLQDRIDELRRREDAYINATVYNGGSDCDRRIRQAVLMARKGEAAAKKLESKRST